MSGQFNICQCVRRGRGCSLHRTLQAILLLNLKERFRGASIGLIDIYTTYYLCGRSAVRDKYRALFHACLRLHGREEPLELVNNADSFTQLILDSTHPSVNKGHLPSEKEIEYKELLSRKYIWSIHLLWCRDLAKGS
ncbi:hypothetical protein DPMN_089171 [Dreissena polymorpha]|uniref:Uncharacterized protein n=1 Tax=Dreissena polymorpha TaxID=45954 RepID=A0A9D4KVW3_DREPO|nr:hypothetical protein DPMN_089171 [Dreissena polymorpha]